jgi:hypothetical protein
MYAMDFYTQFYLLWGTNHPFTDLSNSLLEPIRKISWEPEAMHEMLPIIDIKTQFSRGRNGYIGQN